MSGNHALVENALSASFQTELCEWQLRGSGTWSTLCIYVESIFVGFDA